MGKILVNCCMNDDEFIGRGGIKECRKTARNDFSIKTKNSIFYDGVPLEQVTTV